MNNTVVKSSAAASSSRNKNRNLAIMNNQQPTNIWQIMNYPVPRGKCVHKPSVLSSGCPCLRFMLNPLQAASSFACDGCGHHASFHNLKNGEEEGEGFSPEQMNGVLVATTATPSSAARGKKRSAPARIGNGAPAGRRGVGLLGGVGMMAGGVGSSADEEDEDLEVLEGEKLQVVKRSRA
ncbi:hypothetical protein FN846DRAFT_709647 [Sphaerosporella brunnea]|uniref:Uncharacterized protein n=1 Tax=Sphaerosporella brunnea TaxID=1250544 RepID=A0A5J5EXM6_9PEZI|nr:hypothetical protein FN846DRAFT_709647 [Sphaerosporella brunnea]